MMRNKVVDSSDTRLDKQHRIALYVSTFVEGVSKPDLIAFAMEKGNVARTAGAHIADLEIIEVLQQVNGTYYLNRPRFEAWAYTNGIIKDSVLVRCLTCGNSYESSFTSCPACESVSRALIENTPITQETAPKKAVRTPYTHTHIHPHTPFEPHTQQRPQAKEPLKQPLFSPTQNQEIELQYLEDEIERQSLTGEGPYTYIQTQNQAVLVENTPRQLRVNAGRAAEQRVSAILGPYYRVEMGLGTNGEPDLFAVDEHNKFVVEVKSMLARQGGKPGNVTLKKSAWLAFSQFAEGTNYLRRLIVEVRIPQGEFPFTYYIIPGEMVDYKATKHMGDWISFSVNVLPGFSSELYTPGIPKGRRLWL